MKYLSESKDFTPFIDNDDCKIMNVGDISVSDVKCLFNNNTPILISCIKKDRIDRNITIFINVKEVYYDSIIDVITSLKKKGEIHEILLVSVDKLEQMFGEYTFTMSSYDSEFQKETSSKFLKEYKEKLWKA